MNRRWKVGVVLVFFGIGGFLVWMFRSPAMPPLSIRFSGYVTNNAFRVDGELPPKNGAVLAIFAITNHTRRTMAVQPFSDFRWGVECHPTTGDVD